MNFLIIKGFTGGFSIPKNWMVLIEKIVPFLACV